MRRQKSTFYETYHIINKGVNNMHIFRNDEDKDKYLHLIKKGAEKYEIDVIAYCLMDNHYHLCVSSKNGEYKDITGFMRYANSQYVRYFNETSEPDENGVPRSGSIYGAPYKSIPVNSQFQLDRLVAYIHNNPSPLGVDVKTYEYSSYYRYLNVLSGRKTADEENRMGIVLKFESMEHYSEEELIQLTKDSSKYKFSEGEKSYTGKNYISDELLIDEVEDKYEMSIGEIRKLKEKEKAKVLYEISNMAGVSKKQMERVLVIDYFYLCKLIRKYRLEYKPNIPATQINALETKQVSTARIRDVINLSDNTSRSAYDKRSP